MAQKKNAPRGEQTDTFMPPDTMGAMKKNNPFHMSLDELIAYRATGVRPKLIIDEQQIFELAKIGVSIKNICGLFEISEVSFCQNDTFLNAHQKGRAECGTRIRAMIYQHAENGSLDAAKYLDKISGGDVEATKIEMSVTNQRPAEHASTDDLLEAIEVPVREVKDGND